MSVKNKHLIHYVPHGINSDVFFPIQKNDERLVAFRKGLFGDKDYDFVCFYNSRNINRKRTASIMLAFRSMCDNLPKDMSKRAILVLHTEKILDAGTDLGVIAESMLAELNVLILENRYSPEDMNLLYNIADITVNISSNEGFGLSIAESIMTGTPVIVNVTGGLQDQIGQKDDNGNPIEFGVSFGSNNVGKYKRHGVWAKPVWPTARVIQGSPATPYIFDDLCKWEDVADAMMYWYLMAPESREKCGFEGRRWAMNEGGLNHKNLAEQFIKSMDFTLDNFVPEKPYSLHVDSEYVGHTMPTGGFGFEIPPIDKIRVMEEILSLKL